jgi:hypothetical protein
MFTMILPGITPVKPDQRNAIMVCGVLCVLISVGITLYLFYAWNRREITMISRWGGRTYYQNTSPFGYWFTFCSYLILDGISLFAAIIHFYRLSL